MGKIPYEDKIKCRELTDFFPGQRKRCKNQQNRERKGEHDGDSE